jgi:uncharacterized protein (DUF2267 family)
LWARTSARSASNAVWSTIRARLRVLDAFDLGAVLRLDLSVSFEMVFYHN